MKSSNCNFLSTFACLPNVLPDLERMYLKRILFFITLITTLTGCNFFSEKSPNVSDIPMEITVKPLENKLFACQSVADVQLFLSQHPYLTHGYFTDFPQEDSLLAATLYEHIRNNSLHGFKQEIDSLFRDREKDLKEPLERAFKHIKYYYPDFVPPRIETIVTGFMGNDLTLSDTLIVIGLDYFGGPEATYRPNVYDYQLNRYQKEYLIPSILFFMSDRYNRTEPKDQTLLADMIGYGKAFEFVKHCMPQTPDSLILGFSGRNLVRTYTSQTEIWAFVIENRLLYESTELKKQKYVGERPFVSEIGPDVPGGIGRWLGWRIVSSYLAQHPEITLPELMKISNARQILQESGYKGQLDD